MVLPTRWLRHRVSRVLVYAIAFFAAIAASYVIIFGWPMTSALGARQKIVLLTLAGLLIGVGSSFRNIPFLSSALLIAGPIWIGWPALAQGRSDALLLGLPLIIALLITGFWIRDRSHQSTDTEIELYLLMIIMAVGLALIALFARTLSVMQLGLALASVLAVVVLAGRKHPQRLLLIAGAAMLVGLLTAILLYSQASLPAIIVLSAICGLPCLKVFSSGLSILRTSAWPAVLMAMILTTVAVAIAWIDAGSISVY